MTKVINKINNTDIGITDFSNISGIYNEKNLNLQDAINTLMNATGSKSYIYVGDTAPDGNKQFALWLDTSA